MLDGERSRRVKELTDQIAIEQDRETSSKLISELNRLLDEKKLPANEPIKASSA